MLALRASGLGTEWTTLHLIGEGERQATDLLGIPYEQYAQGGLFPIAYTKGSWNQSPYPLVRGSTPAIRDR